MIRFSIFTYYDVKKIKHIEIVIVTREYLSNPKHLFPHFHFLFYKKSDSSQVLNPYPGKYPVCSGVCTCVYCGKIGKILKKFPVVM